MPVDDLAYVPYFASNYSLIPGVASNQEIHSSLTVKRIAQALYCAGWTWVGEFNATALLPYNLAPTVTEPIPPPGSKPTVNCAGSHPFYEFIADDRLCSEGDWLVGFDPYRETAGTGCGPNAGCLFPWGLTEASTRANMYACDVLDTLGISMQDEEDPPGTYTGYVLTQSTAGGFHANGMQFTGNGIRSVSGLLWGGGYHLRSAAGNTGAQVDIEITEELDNFHSSADSVLTSRGLATSKIVFRVYRTPTTAGEMDPETGNRANAKLFSILLWPEIPNPAPVCMQPIRYRHNYYLVANKYQVWVFGIPNQFGVSAGYTIHSKASAFMCSVPYVDDDALAGGTVNLKPIVACGSVDGFSSTNPDTGMKKGPHMQAMWVSWGTPASGADIMNSDPNSISGLLTWEGYYGDVKWFGGDPLHHAAFVTAHYDHSSPDQDNDNPIAGRLWNCQVMATNDYEVGAIIDFDNKRWICAGRMDAGQERSHASVWLMLEDNFACPPIP